MKKTYRILWIPVLLLVLGIAIIVIRRDGALPQLPFVQHKLDVTTQPLFVEGLQAAGVAADTIGFHGFSPDGTYFYMSVFSQGSGNSAWVLNLGERTLTKLPGMIERGFDDSRVLQTTTASGIALFTTANERTSSYDIGSNAWYGSLSPDGTTYVVNTANGMKRIDPVSAEAVGVTKKAGDSAFLWLSDSTHMLGFKETNENLWEAGFARVFGTWNIQDGTFVPFVNNKEITQKTPGYLQWVVPQKVVRVNAGYDDGSYDYLINIETNEVHFIGDTSQSRMGGVATDTDRGLFGVLAASTGYGPKAQLYKGMELLGEVELPTAYYRESMHIVDEDTLFYIKRAEGNSMETESELVLLNMSTGEERVVETLPKGHATLSLAPDHTSWVASVGNVFYTGMLY